MLVHPSGNAFNLLNNDGSAYGKRHFIVISNARFIIDKELQAKSIRTGQMLIHAWVAGDVSVALYGQIPAEQVFNGWCEVMYRPGPDATFTLRGLPVSPLDEFDVAICTRYRDRQVVLVQAKKVEPPC